MLLSLTKKIGGYLECRRLWQKPKEGRTGNEPKMEIIRYRRKLNQVSVKAMALVVLPLAFLIVTLQLTKVSGPSWLSTNFENNYPYLFNSLLLVNGKTPVYLDHPGVTTELFGAVVLQWSGSGSGNNVTERVLTDPDRAIKRIQRALLIFTGFVLWVAPLLTSVYLQRFVLGLLIQLPSLFFISLLRYTIWFSSDLMLVSVSVIAICLCVILMYQRKLGRQRLWAIACAGVACALGIATKLTFFPLIIILVACCSGLKNRAILLVTLVLALACVFAPVYPNLHKLIPWTLDLLTHTGNYGSGAPGFTQPDILWGGIVKLLSREPKIGWVPLVSTLAILFLLVIGRIRRIVPAKKGIAETALTLFALQILGFLLVAKHAYYHYLIPLYLSTGLNLILLYEASVRNRKSAVLTSFGIGLLSLISLWSLFDSGRQIVQWYGVLLGAARQQLAMYQRVKKLTAGELRVDYYRCSSPEFAAWFGDEYAGWYFGAALQSKYPHAIMSTINGGSVEGIKFWTFTLNLDPVVVLEGHNRLYFFGNHTDETGTPGIVVKIPGLNGNDIKMVDSAGGYFLDYLDEWTRPAEPPATLPQPTN
jgi:hypothetical protein